MLIQGNIDIRTLFRLILRITQQEYIVILLSTMGIGGKGPYTTHLFYL